MPSRISAVNSQVMQNYFKEHPQFKVAVDQLKYAVKRVVDPNSPQLENVMMNEIQKAVIDKNYTPKQALQAINTAAKKLFK